MALLVGIRINSIENSSETISLEFHWTKFRFLWNIWRSWHKVISYLSMKLLHLYDDILRKKGNEAIGIIFGNTRQPTIQPFIYVSAQTEKFPIVSIFWDLLEVHQGKIFASAVSFLQNRSKIVHQSFANRHSDILIIYHQSVTSFRSCLQPKTGREVYNDIRFVLLPRFPWWTSGWTCSCVMWTINEPPLNCR